MPVRPSGAIPSFICVEQQQSSSDATLEQTALYLRRFSISRESHHPYAPNKRRGHSSTPRTRGKHNLTKPIHHQQQHFSHCRFHLNEGIHNNSDSIMETGSFDNDSRQAQLKLYMQSRRLRLSQRRIQRPKPKQQQQQQQQPINPLDASDMSLDESDIIDHNEIDIDFDFDGSVGNEINSTFSMDQNQYTQYMWELKERLGERARSATKTRSNFLSERRLSAGGRVDHVQRVVRRHRAEQEKRQHRARDELEQKMMKAVARRNAYLESAIENDPSKRFRRRKSTTTTSSSSSSLVGPNSELTGKRSSQSTSSSSGTVVAVEVAGTVTSATSKGSTRQSTLTARSLMRGHEKGSAKNSSSNMTSTNNGGKIEKSSGGAISNLSQTKAKPEDKLMMIMNREDSKKQKVIHHDPAEISAQRKAQEMMVQQASREYMQAIGGSHQRLLSLSFEELAKILHTNKTLIQATVRLLKYSSQLLQMDASSEQPWPRRVFQNPARVFLSMYMVLAHPSQIRSPEEPASDTHAPDQQLNNDHEFNSLIEASNTLLEALQAWMTSALQSDIPPVQDTNTDILQDQSTPLQSIDNLSSITTTDNPISTSQEIVDKPNLDPIVLREFDNAWTSYYNLFQAWKNKDASRLLQTLLDHATTIESLWRTVSGDPVARAEWGPRIDEQRRDLRAKAEQLAGADGANRLDLIFQDFVSATSSPRTISRAPTPMSPHLSSQMPPQASPQISPRVSPRMSPQSTGVASATTASVSPSLTPTVVADPGTPPQKKRQRTPSPSQRTPSPRLIDDDDDNEALSPPLSDTSDTPDIGSKESTVFPESTMDTESTMNSGSTITSESTMDIESTKNPESASIVDPQQPKSKKASKAKAVPATSAGASLPKSPLGSIPYGFQKPAKWSNLQMVHELALDSNFKIEHNQPLVVSGEQMEGTSSSSSSAGPGGINNLEAQIKAIATKAYFDKIREDAEKGELGQWIPSLLSTIRDQILDMVPATSKIAINFSEGFDIELVKQQVDKNVYDIERALETVLDTMGKLCAPARDPTIKKIKNDLMEYYHAKQQEQLEGSQSETPGSPKTYSASSTSPKDLVSVLQAILELLDVMMLDMANFRLNMARPTLEKEAIPYEQGVFKELLDKEEISLEATKAWLNGSVTNFLASPPASSLAARERENGNDGVHRQVFYEILVSAILDLVFSSKHFDVSPDREAFPETLYLDRERMSRFQNEAQGIAIAAVIMNISQNTAPTLNDDALKELKQTLLALLESPQTSIETLSDAVIEAKEKALLAASLQVDPTRSPLPEISSTKGLLLTPEQKSFIKNTLERSISLDSTLFRVLSDKIRKVMEAVLLFPRETTSAVSKHRRVGQMPDISTLSKMGLGSFGTDIERLATEIRYLTKYNAQVFRLWYDSILTHLVTNLTPSATSSSSNPPSTSENPSV